ncbi:competence protein ComK [Metabacillus bambusae]|uniref:Competence protein ComK n=1 Tax=Metabacillus bambusae TaxID=2795218 RepID=A0ABS3N0U1_9BACI|nr:competence protein ComK [Metabacillus bambusae]MBO1511878.1 competence protein ComK [Metabacillus bambusae]
MNNNQNKSHQVKEEKLHIINENTMALIPKYTKLAELHSTVFEKYKVENVSRSPLDIVEDSCDYYGSDLSGRINSAQKILKGQRMLPVIISEVNKYCMVPLCSPKNTNCIWLAYKHVIDIVPKGNHSIIIFSNQKKLKLEINRVVLEDKLNKGARLISTYDIRQEQATDLYKMNVVAEKASLYTSGRNTYDDQIDR